MVICKFFLQGECKFGDNCRFEHQIPSATSGSSGSLFGSVPSQQYPSKPATEVDTNTLVTSVHNDMVAVEKCGQWLLSCYAPFKEKQLFPGFQDQSFEEVRWGCYEAQRTNTFQQYKQQLQQALLEAKTRFKALQTPSKEIISVLRNIYNTPPSQTESSVFGNGPKQNSGGIFGQNVQNINQQNMGNIFGQNPVHPGSFSQQSQNTFGQQNQSIFGQNNATTGMFAQNTGQQNSIFASTNQNIFGNPNNTSAFQQNQSSTLFPNNQNAFAPPPQSSIFGQDSAQNSQNKSIFAASPFGNMTAQNVPMANQNNQQNSILTQQNSQSNSIFTGQNTQSNSLFNSQHTNTIFAPQTQSSTLFNSASQAAPAKSIFGQSSQTNSGNIFNTQNNAINHEAYSKIEELSEADISWFKSNDLDIKNMPTKPPTYELCFG